MTELTKVEVQIPPRTRVRPVVICEGQGRTHQEMADDCDVNKIVNAWRNTGTNPHVNHNAPYYGDLSASQDLQESLNHVMASDAAFAALPAAVRDSCNNDQVQFLSMLNDDEAREELLDAGLRIEQPPTEEPPLEAAAAAVEAEKPTKSVENPPTPTGGE